MNAAEKSIPPKWRKNSLLTTYSGDDSVGLDTKPAFVAPAQRKGKTRGKTAAPFMTAWVTPPDKETRSNSDQAGHYGPPDRCLICCGDKSQCGWKAPTPPLSTPCKTVIKRWLCMACASRTSLLPASSFRVAHVYGSIIPGLRWLLYFFSVVNFSRFMEPHVSFPLRYLMQPMNRMMVLNCLKPKLSINA